MRPIPSYVGSLFPGAYQAAAIPAVKSIIEDYGDNQQLHTAVDSARQSARLVISSWGMMKITEMWNDIAQRGPEDPSFAVETAIQDEPAPETSTAIVPLSPYHKAMEDAVAAVKQKLPAIEKMIADKRRETFGLYPLGAKIHVLHTVDEEMLKRLEKILSYERGCFGLQHSNHTLVLPPMPSSAEMEWVVGFLDFHRVLDKVYPEIQICLPGRLKPESCAYLGATVLLATKEGTKYKEDSFATKDDSYTGFRIMVYDKGGRRLPFPFEPETLGRTDMLGRRDLKDFDIYQLVGTVLVQDEARQKSPAAAPFAHLAGEYRARFREILGRYGIASVLDASWILVPGEKFDAKDGISHYRDAICPCVNAWFNDYAAYKQGKRASGAVYETRRLVDWLRDQVNIVQGKMLAGSGYDRQKELLFRMGGRSYVL